jgi:hypothetical protein
MCLTWDAPFRSYKTTQFCVDTGLPDVKDTRYGSAGVVTGASSYVAFAVKAFPSDTRPLDALVIVNTMSPSHLLYSFRTRPSSRACLGGAQARLVQVGLSLRPAVQFCAGIRSPRYTSTMSPTPANPVQSKTPKKALEPMEQVVGDSGRQYLIQKTLQEKEGYPCRVYLAT